MSDTALVPVSQSEHLVEVAHRIPVDAGRVDATDEVCTIAEGGVEQVESPRIAQDPALGEGHDLDVSTIVMGVTGSHHPLEALEPAVGVDLGMASDAGCAVFDHPRGRERGPVSHAGTGPPPVPAVVLDELDQALARAVGAEGKTETAGVEVGMGIDEAGQGDSAAAICLGELTERRDLGVDSDRPDAIIDAQDVDGCIVGQVGPRPHIADQQPPAHAASLRSGGCTGSGPGPGTD